MIAGDTEIVVRAGEVLLIPASVEHEVWVLEDSLVFDFFAPPREDWRAGHERFWHSAEVRSELGDPGFTVSDDTLVVAQTFRLAGD